jgi:hypothetical protein
MSGYTIGALMESLAGRSHEYSLFISHAWDYKDDYEGVVSLLSPSWDFRWKNLSVPQEDPLPTLFRLPKSHRYLVRQLDERIAKSDCLLVLDAMYVAHRGWIQSEIEAAQEFGKPIIAIAPRGQERFSEVLKYAADEKVGWNRASIVGAIRRLCTPAPAMQSAMSALLGGTPAPPSAGFTLASLIGQAEPKSSEPSINLFLGGDWPKK